MSQGGLKSMNKDQLINLIQELRSENCQLKEEKQMLDQIDSKLSELQSDLAVLKNVNRLLVERISKLERRCSQMEQYSRRECLEFTGISESVQQNDLEDKVRTILTKIDVNVSSENIEACHRIGKNGKTLVKFSRRKDIGQIFHKKSLLKEIDPLTLNFPASTKIYINESLCPSNRHLWFLCKKLWQSKKIYSFWTSQGSVKLKLKNLGNAKTIEQITDLEDIFPDVNFEIMSKI